MTTGNEGAGKMRLAYISKFFSIKDKIGGSVNYTREICAELAKKTDFTLVTGSFGNRTDESIDYGFNVEYVKGANFSFSGQELIFPPFPALAAGKVRKLKPDMMHFTTTMFYPVIQFPYFKMFSLPAGMGKMAFQPM